MLSLHKLFLNGDDSRSFHEVIVPTRQQRETLLAVKNVIRDHLRTTIRQASKTVLGMDRMVDPRFRTQGSWAYRTCVQPAHTPPQEMDWDFENPSSIPGFGPERPGHRLKNFVDGSLGDWPAKKETPAGL